jgi:hypothetical protein
MQPTGSIEPTFVLGHVVEAPGRHRRSVPATPVAHAVPGQRTPLWTRHTLGAIESGRDRRLERRVSAPVRYRTAPRARAFVTRADFAGDRWADEGGSFDREVVAAVRGATQRR